jgi:hypothetical protein
MAGITRLAALNGGCRLGGRRDQIEHDIRWRDCFP